MTEYKSLLQAINSYPEHAKEALETLYHGKTFAVSNNYNNHVERFFKTKRGAQGYIKRSQSVSWYDDYTKEMVSGGSGLYIEEIKAEQIENPSTSKKLWYKYLRSINGHDYLYNNCLYYLDSCNVSDEIREYVTSTIEGMRDNGGMTVLDEYEESEIAQIENEETATESQEQPKQEDETQDTHNNDNSTKQTDDITASYVLNDEKNGIEISFTGKPSEEIREQLKAYKFRWSRAKKIWYAKQSQERLEFTQNLCNASDNKETDNNDNSEQENPQHKTTETQITFEYPTIDINDIETYTVSDELRDREHDSAWIFRTHKRNLTGEIQMILKRQHDKVLDVLQTTDNESIKYHLKKQLQSFKKQYYNNYIKQLENRANNPSWAVTGRAGRNRSKDIKANNRYDDLMRESIRLEKWIKSKISGAQTRIQRDERSKLDRKANNTDINISFKTERKQFEFMGIKENKRVYSHGNYFICKLWGCFRLLEETESGAVRELDIDLRTTDTLETAKKYMTMVINQTNNQQETA